MFYVELATKSPYKASISGKKLRLQELQEEDAKTQKIKTEKRESWEEINRVLYHQGLPYVF